MAEALRLSPALRQQLRELALDAYPHEACAALLGPVGALGVSQVLPLPNSATDSKQCFAIAADELLRASRLARAQGLELNGFFHSHPEGDARPSLADLTQGPSWAGYLQLIMAIDASGRHELRAYQTASDCWHEQAIHGDSPMATVIIPTPLRSYAQGQAQVQAEGQTVAEVLQALVQHCSALQQQLFNDEGQLRRFINLFINDEDVRLHEGLHTAVQAGDRLEILPAIAGGISFPEWRGQLQQTLPQVDAGELLAARSSGQAPVLIDVRTDEEWAQGHIPDALHLDRGFLEVKVESLVPDKQTPLLVCCESGTRSLFAALALQTLGYARVANLRGGLKAWKELGQPLIQPRLLRQDQRRRYLRHLAIPEVGEAGQLKLLSARVLMIGAGGLGCPAALYLAAAGVGRLGIVDNDVVDESNLQRQVLHSHERVGMAKTTSARLAIEALNPDVEVIEHQQRLLAADALALLQDYDLVIDGSDNFATRYLINDACVQLGKPFVHGSVFRFEGQVSVFWPGHGPCYRCLHPEPPPPALAPSCAEAGVLGVLPGVIGLLQATEAIKLLLGQGEALLGRSLRYDALAARFRELRYAVDPHCSCQASGAGFSALIDMDAAVCALG